MKPSFYFCINHLQLLSHCNKRSSFFFPLAEATPAQLQYSPRQQMSAQCRRNAQRL